MKLKKNKHTQRSKLGIWITSTHQSGFGGVFFSLARIPVSERIYKCAFYIKNIVVDAHFFPMVYILTVAGDSTSSSANI